MSGLKAGWRRVKFGEIAHCVNDRVDDPSQSGVDRYVGLEHLDSGSLTIRRWGTPEQVESTKLRFRPGDIIFGKRRAYQRKLAVADFEGICSAHAMVLRAKPTHVLPEFLPFFMQSDVFMERAQAISVGSLSPTINWKTLASEEFGLPPLAEQAKIRDLLGAMASGVESARSLQLESASLLGALRESLTGAPPRNELSRLGDAATMQNGRPFSSDDYQSTGVRLLRPANLHESGRLDWRSERTTHVPSRYEEEASRFVVKPGDLVINLTAQSLDDGFMGRVCFARDGDISLLNQRIGRIVTDPKRLLGEYLFRVLQCSKFQAHAVAMCEGTKVKHLFWRHLERFLLPVPPLDYQRAALEHLNEVEQTCVRVDRRLLDAKALSQRMARVLEPGALA